MKKFIVMCGNEKFSYKAGEFDSFESAKAYAEAYNDSHHRYGIDSEYLVYEMK